MWPFIPTVFLFVAAIIVSLKIESSLSELTQPADEENASSDNNRAGQISMNVLKTWKEKEPLVIWQLYGKEIDRNTDSTEGQRKPVDLYDTQNPEHNRRMVSSANAFSKREENVEPWLDLPTENNKELRDPLSSFSSSSSPPPQPPQPPPAPSSQKKKKKKTTKTMTRTRTKTKTTETTTNPWIYHRWGNKRRETMYGASSNIRRPIRVPFNRWGGKRGKEHLRSAATLFPAKRSKLTMYDRYDRYDPDSSVNGYEVKREIADFEKVKWKTPFNSWGGKRAGKSVDREGDVPLTEDHPGDAPILGVFKEYGFTKERNNGNNNDDFLYRIPFYLYNETSKDNSVTRDDVNERISSTPNKRVEYHDHEICKKATFNSWHGKRDIKPRTYLLSRKNNALLTFSSMGKITLCCYYIVINEPK